MNVPRPQRSPLAFTLAEMILVVATTGIVAAIAIPTFAKPTARQRLHLAAARVASDVRYAAVLARTTGTARTLTVNPAARSVSVAPAADGTAALNLADWPFRVTAITADFDGAAAVEFDIWGQPRAGGTVTLSAGGQQRVVSIDRTTGEVTVR